MTTGRPIKTHLRPNVSGYEVSRARRNGYHLNEPIYTVDGDEVVILAVQLNHPFPIVGEVHDDHANISWLARWNAGGRYRGTPEAESRHSLERNGRTQIKLNVLGPHFIATGGQDDDTAKVPNYTLNDPFVEYAEGFEEAVEYAEGFEEAVQAATRKAPPPPNNGLTPGLTDILLRAYRDPDVPDRIVHRTGHLAQTLLNEGRITIHVNNFGELPFMALAELVVSAYDEHPTSSFAIREVTPNFGFIEVV